MTASGRFASGSKLRELEIPFDYDVPSVVRDYLARFGRAQVARDLPADWRRRRNRAPGGCYEAAHRWAAREPERVIYTEGVALCVGVSSWGSHAWLTERATGEVIDLAWHGGPSFPSGLRYFGVQLPPDALATIACLPNDPRLGSLIRTGWTPD